MYAAAGITASLAAILAIFFKPHYHRMMAEKSNDVTMEETARRQSECTPNGDIQNSTL